MAEKKKEDVAIDLKDDAQDQSEISVELDQNNEPVKPAEQKKSEPQYVTIDELRKLEKAQNASFYQARKIQEQLEALSKNLQPREVVEKRDLTDEDKLWEDKLNKNWKGTVEEISEIKIQAVLERQEKERAVKEEKAKAISLLTQNKMKVMERHPDLEEPGSEKQQVFQQVLNENPEYLTNPFGPVLAMRDMEERLKEQGKWIDAPTRKIVDKEVMRSARAGAGSLPNGNAASGNQKIILTKDEREFCDTHGLKYESYAKSKGRLSKNSKEGVEV